MIVWFFWWSLFAQDAPWANTLSWLVYWAWVNEFNPTTWWQLSTWSIQNNTVSWSTIQENASSVNDCRFVNKDITDVSLVPPSLVPWNCETNTCPTDAQYIEKRVSTVQWDIVLCEKCDMDKCNCGVKLNTNVPFIGRCIMYENTNDIWANGDETTTVNPINAFPVLMGALVKILMSVIMIICFASLIIGGFMMTVPDQYNTWKWIVKKVIWTIVWLWSLWTLLYLINPNFFS